MEENKEAPKTVRCRNPQNGVVYVYTYESFYDPVQEKYRQKRRCIGKVDEETGEVVPTASRGGGRKNTLKTEAAEGEEIGKAKREEQERIASYLRQIQELKEQVQTLEVELSQAREEIKREKDEKENLVKAVRAALESYEKRERAEE